jgi:hypothetical protein
MEGDKMTDEERARKLCAYEGPLFGIVHMTDEQRIVREDLLIAHFAAIRDAGKGELLEALKAVVEWMGEREIQNWPSVLEAIAKAGSSASGAALVGSHGRDYGNG